MRGSSEFIGTLYQKGSDSISSLIHASADSTTDVIDHLAHGTGNVLNILLEGTTQIFCNIITVLFLTALIFGISYLAFLWLWANRPSLSEKLQRLKTRFSKDPDPDLDPDPPLELEPLNDPHEHFDHCSDQSLSMISQEHKCPSKFCSNSSINEPEVCSLQNLEMKKCTIPATINSVPVVGTL